MQQSSERGPRRIFTQILKGNMPKASSTAFNCEEGLAFCATPPQPITGTITSTCSARIKREKLRRVEKEAMNSSEGS